jgi:hypothetical protein
MAILDDLITALSTATPDQTYQIVSGLVAPLPDTQKAEIANIIWPPTKLQQLTTDSQTQMADVNAAYARAKALVQTAINSINNGDTTTVLPSWLDILKAFDGGKTNLSTATPA